VLRLGSPELAGAETGLHGDFEIEVKGMRGTELVSAGGAARYRPRRSPLRTGALKILTRTRSIHTFLIMKAEYDRNKRGLLQGLEGGKGGAGDTGGADGKDDSGGKASRAAVGKDDSGGKASRAAAGRVSKVSSRAAFGAASARVSAAAVMMIMILLTVLLGLAGCRQEEVAEPFEPTESHMAYREGLEKMDLADTELGRRWITAAEEAFGQAVEIEMPFKEDLFFDPADPEAQGYLFSAERGRSISITIERRDEADLRLFADLYRLDSEGFEPEEQVASYSREEDALVFEPRRDNRYVLRIQPELLRGGMFTVTIIEEPVLAFPVEGKSMVDIQSFFGDPRDGGRRRHEGVDVFAPRGTNVLAVTDGVIRRVGTRDLGGNIVLLWDERRNLHYYYAHLDAQYVVSGQRVSVGDPLGAVGNTGNAITTPPHLHFGVYEPRFRAVDPWNFIKPGRGAPDEPVKLDGAEGSFVRTVAEVPSDDPREAVPAGTILRVRGIGPETVRAILPHENRIIEVSYPVIEPAGSIDRTAGPGTEIGSSVDPLDPFLYSAPEPRGERIAQLQPSDSVSLLGTSGSFLFVETPAGVRGWMRRM